MLWATHLTAGLIAATAALGYLIGANRWPYLEPPERWITLYLLGSSTLQVVQIVAAIMGNSVGTISNIWVSWALVTLFSALIESVAESLRGFLRVLQWLLVGAWAAYFMWFRSLSVYRNVTFLGFAICAMLLSLLVVLHNIDSEDDRAFWMGGAMLMVGAADLAAFAYLAKLIPATKNALISAWILQNCCWIIAHLCFIRNLRCSSPTSSSSRC